MEVDPRMVCAHGEMSGRLPAGGQEEGRGPKIVRGVAREVPLSVEIAMNFDVDVIKNTLGASSGPLAPEPSAAYQPLE